MTYESLWYKVKKRKKYERRSKNVPKKFKGKNEKFFLNYIVRLFKKKGCLVYHQDTRNPKYAWIIGRGFPDLVIAKTFRIKKRRKTIVIFAEVKTERGYPTKDQIIWMDVLPKKRTFLWRPSSHTDIVRISKIFAKQNN